MSLFRSKKAKELGATIIEYALLAALIAVVAIAGIQLIGTSVSQQFSNIANQL